MAETLDLFEPEAEPISDSWTPSAETAIARLHAFLPKAGKAYAARRNYDYGPGKHGNVSCLSPYTRHRLILEEEIARETLSRHSYNSAEKFIQEVFWRTYFKGWLEHRPQVWQGYLKSVASLNDRLVQNAGLRTAYEEATEGRTGIECFDHWAQELAETGYLHNHARMWFASIWIFTLKLPWELGAKFFYENLLDGDPASNTLSWRWVGGLHTVGKTYLARADNIQRYTNGAFFPRGQLAEVADPLPYDEPGDAQKLNLPQSPKDLSRSAMLITAEDCHAGTLLPEVQWKTSAMLLHHGDAEGHVDTAMKRKFRYDAVNDAGRRFANETGMAVEALEGEDWLQKTIHWAKSNDLESITTAFAPIGPIRDHLDMLEKALSHENIRLNRIVREYDLLCWPHCRKGFFALKQKIPELITEFGMI